jgi:hypothetical protein
VPSETTLHYWAYQSPEIAWDAMQSTFITMYQSWNGRAYVNTPLQVDAGRSVGEGIMEEEGRKPSQLFTLRVWTEAVGDSQTEWRGKVQHIATGEARYFRSWQALVEFLERRMSEGADDLSGSNKRA